MHAQSTVLLTTILQILPD